MPKKPEGGKKPEKGKKLPKGLGARFIERVEKLRGMEAEVHDTAARAHDLESKGKFADAAGAWEIALGQSSMVDSELKRAEAEASAEEKGTLAFEKTNPDTYRINAGVNYARAGKASSATTLFFQAILRDPASREAEQARRGIASLIASPFLRIPARERIELISKVRSRGPEFEKGIVKGLRAVGVRVAPDAPPGKVLATIRDQIAATTAKPIPAAKPAAMPPLKKAPQRQVAMPQVPAAKPAAPPAKPPPVTPAPPSAAQPQRRRYAKPVVTKGKRQYERPAAKPRVLKARPEIVPEMMRPGFARTAAERLFKLNRGTEAVETLVKAGLFGEVAKRFRHSSFRPAVVGYLMRSGDSELMKKVESLNISKGGFKGEVADAIEKEYHRRAAEKRAEEERIRKEAERAAQEMEASTAEQISRALIMDKQYAKAVNNLLTHGVYDRVVESLFRPDAAVVAPHAARALRADRRQMMRLTRHYALSRNIREIDAFRELNRRITSVLRVPAGARAVSRARERKEAALRRKTFAGRKVPRVEAARRIAEAKAARQAAAVQPVALIERIANLKGEKRERYVQWLIREKRADILFNGILSLQGTARAEYLNTLLKNKAYAVLAVAYNDPKTRTALSEHMRNRPQGEIETLSKAVSLLRGSDLAEERRQIYELLAEAHLLAGVGAGGITNAKEFNSAVSKYLAAGNKEKISDMFFSQQLAKPAADAVISAVRALPPAKRKAEYAEIKNFLIGKAPEAAKARGETITREQALDRVDMLLEPRVYEHRQNQRMQALIQSYKGRLGPAGERLAAQGKRLISEIAEKQNPAYTGSLDVILTRLNAAMEKRKAEYDSTLDAFEKDILKRTAFFKDGIGIDKREHPYRFLAEVFRRNEPKARYYMLRQLVLLSETRAGRAEAQEHLSSLKKEVAMLEGAAKGAAEDFRKKILKRVSGDVDKAFKQVSEQVRVRSRLFEEGMDVEEAQSLVLRDLNSAKQRYNALVRQRRAGRREAAKQVAAEKIKLGHEKAAAIWKAAKERLPKPIVRAKEALEKRRRRLAEETARAGPKETVIGRAKKARAAAGERARKPVAAAGAAALAFIKKPFLKIGELFERAQPTPEEIERRGLYRSIFSFEGIKSSLKLLATERGKREYVSSVVSAGERVGAGALKKAAKLHAGEYKPLAQLEAGTRLAAEAHDLAAAEQHKDAASRYIEAGSKFLARREADALMNEGAVLGKEAKKLGIGNFLDAARIYEKLELKEQAAMAHEKAGDYENAVRLWDAAGRTAESAGIKELNEDFFEAGKDFINAGDNKSVARVAHKLADGGDYEKAGELLSRVGRHAKAAKAYRKGGFAKKEAEMYRKVHNHKAVKRVAIRLRKDKRDLEAVELLESVGMHGDAAKIYKNHGDYEKAAIAFRTEGNILQEAECYVLAGDYEKAAKVYESQKMPKKAAKAYEDSALFLQGLADERRAAAAAEAVTAERMRERDEPGHEEHSQRAGILASEASSFEHKGRVAYDEASRLYKDANSRKNYLRCLELSGKPEKALQAMGAI